MLLRRKLNAYYQLRKREKRIQDIYMKALYQSILKHLQELGNCEVK